MIKSLFYSTVVASLCVASAGHAAHHEAGEKVAAAKTSIKQAVSKNKFRTELDIERDQFRSPIETLTFFGIKPDMTLVEVGPGGGWYTRILAPLVAEDGKYIATAYTPDPKSKRYAQSMKWRETYTAGPMFGKQASARFVGGPVPFAAPDSVDAILIFRGMHGMISYSDADANLAEMFTTLKPGGVLGIVQHREKEDFDNDPKKNMRGYVKQSYIIDLVERAGFKLAGSSEINANPKDPADWPKGVWTLQAGKPLKEKDAKFVAIGESDRMTLKFIKPTGTGR
ncbi:MAG: methyltransferase domain-containing protein [Pseudomonadota bacterium]